MLCRILVLVALLASAPALADDPLRDIRIEPEQNINFSRARDYGGWATPEPCMSTRMIVLRAESEPSKVRIRTKANGDCDVWMGRWHEPYVGYVTTDPRKLDIDHLVPLKEAHRSGAYQWTKTRRVAYANYLKDEWHLIAVDAGANRSKGDKDPAEWLPPNEAFLCAYLTHWVEVKRQWNLSMDQAEAEAIRAELPTCR